jgi:hypothetical protein
LTTTFTLLENCRFGYDALLLEQNLRLSMTLGNCAHVLATHVTGGTIQARIVPPLT